jgi:lipoyl(octanoyl) transferase
LRPLISQHSSRVCEARYLGRIAYAEAHDLQEALVARRKAGDVPDTLLLLEHPHVITLGRSSNRANVIASEVERANLSVELFETGRGGDVTYHGPGQLVGYPIVNLAPDRCDIRKYVRDLEEVLIRTASDFGVTAGRIAGLTGIWVNGAKLAAIGVRISRWVTMHGFALNVTTDLSYFQLIVPCGISDRTVTSLEKLLGEKVDLEHVARSVASHFGEVFERKIASIEFEL